MRGLLTSGRWGEPLAAKASGALASHPSCLTALAPAPAPRVLTPCFLGTAQVEKETLFPPTLLGGGRGFADRLQADAWRAFHTELLSHSLWIGRPWELQVRRLCGKKPSWLQAVTGAPCRWVGAVPSLGHEASASSACLGEILTHSTVMFIFTNVLSVVCGCTSRKLDDASFAIFVNSKFIFSVVRRRRALDSWLLPAQAHPVREGSALSLPGGQTRTWG